MKKRNFQMGSFIMKGPLPEKEEGQKIKIKKT
jgi:hypothetical protein